MIPEPCHQPENSCAAPEVTIPDNADVCLGFDGSFSEDSTALVVVTCSETPHIDVAGCWEKPPTAGPDWIVPILEIEQAIRDACRRWNVREIACDPYGYRRTYAVLTDEGLPVVDYPQNASLMSPAIQRFYEIVMNRGLTHSGDPRMGRHVSNAVLKTDARGQRRSTLPVMALDRASATPETSAPTSAHGT